MAKSGDLDQSFGGSGVTYTLFKKSIFPNVITMDSGGEDAALTPDGGFLVAGYANDNQVLKFAVAKYKADGKLDTEGFNPCSGFTCVSAGRVVTDFGNGVSTEAQSVAVLPNGKFFVGGYYADPSFNYGFALAKYNADGSLDQSFSGDGKVTTLVGSEAMDLAFSVLPLPDGRVVLAGESGSVIGSQFALVAYKEDGTLDTGFGQEGKTVTSIWNGASIASIALSHDGKILVGGYVKDVNVLKFIVAKYTLNGSLDQSFGTGGKSVFQAGYVTTGSSTVSSSIQSIVVLPDGRIVAAGMVKVGGVDRFVLARFNADGSVDQSFGQWGEVVTAVGSDGLSGAKDIVVLDDGRLLVTGSVKDGGIGKFGLVAYDADGSLDQSFGSEGRVVSTFGTVSEASSLLKMGSGSVVLAGFATVESSPPQFAVAKYLVEPKPAEQDGDSKDGESESQQNGGVSRVGSGNSTEVPPVVSRRLPPQAAFTGLCKGKSRCTLKLKRLSKLAGTVSSAVDTAKVQVNLVLKRGKKCMAYTSKLRLASSSCKKAQSTWVTAQLTRTGRWSLRVKGMRAGKFVARVRAVSRKGEQQRSFKAGTSSLSLTVKR